MLQDGNIRVGIFPERKKIIIGTQRPDASRNNRIARDGKRQLVDDHAGKLRTRHVYALPETRSGEEDGVRRRPEANVREVQSLLGAVNQHKAEMGIFIMLAKPTKGMLEVAHNSGTYENPMIAAAFKATNSKDDFGVRESIVMAVNHVSFAATSDDASLNVQKSAPQFAADSAHLVERCDLIALLSKDVASSTSVTEASVSVSEIAKLAQANLLGDDSNGDGVVGSVPAEYGVLQLRKELERDRENHSAGHAVGS